MTRLRAAAPYATLLTGLTITAYAVTTWWRWEPVATAAGLLLAVVALYYDFGGTNEAD